MSSQSPSEAHRPKAVNGSRTVGRHTQVERSSDTRKRLCDAAVDLLSEVGYERLTTAQIAQRAGVSKGAQAHHYPSKDDLLVAAFQHLLSQWEAKRESYARLHGDHATMADLLENMWRRVFGRPDYLASMEVMLAARHHPTLRKRLREVLEGWTVARDETFRRLVPLQDPEKLATFLQVNFCVLRGLALFDGLAENKKLPQRVLAMWTDIASAYLEAHRSPASGNKTPTVSPISTGVQP